MSLPGFRILRATDVHTAMIYVAIHFINEWGALICTAQLCVYPIIHAGTLTEYQDFFLHFHDRGLL